MRERLEDLVLPDLLVLDLVTIWFLQERCQPSTNARNVGVAVRSEFLHTPYVR